ncbi:MAG: hypothetical protein ACRDX9_11305 [Acidimicrobiia bacterium]
MAAERKDHPKAIRAWITYDWANSAYDTTILAAVLPAYFAAEVVGDGGVDLLGRNWSGLDLWALAVGVGPLLMLLATPILGAIADFSASKKRFLMVFATGGAIFAALLFLVIAGDVFLALGLFLLAHLGSLSRSSSSWAFCSSVLSTSRRDATTARRFAPRWPSHRITVT